jgi:hypothetical protein
MQAHVAEPIVKRAISFGPRDNLFVNTVDRLCRAGGARFRERHRFKCHRFKSGRCRQLTGC